MFCRLFAILTLGIVLGTSAGAGGAKKDLDLLQGFWKAEKMTAGGMDMPAEVVKDIMMEFKGSEVNDIQNGKSMPGGKFKLDETKKPKEIDLTNAEGKKALGIYEIKGDTFTMCLSEKARPKTLESLAGSETYLMVLKRVKK